MGVFEFVKDAGKKIFGDTGEQEETAESTAREARGAHHRHRLRRLEEELDRLDLEVDGRKLELDGSRVTVRGTVAGPVDREKVILALGNVSGIEEVRDELTVPGGPAEGSEEGGEPRFHTVEEGDTLSALAKRYYGDATRYDVIFEANRPMLEDPDKIYVGQELRIPTDPRIG
ncbi:MAG: peptidoglycan-binding protein LysM [Thermoanaerobaculia bacterium]|nr:peptidoglycan-binding protein LysM [Thermoanaerobaculia bacterium]